MDQKIKKALDLFAEGLDRHEVALRLGYKNYKVLDMYFRRKNYRWKPNLGTYSPIEPSPAISAPPLQDVLLSKPQQIISLLSLPNKDPRDVALQVGFKDIQQMADYMSDRGFAWDSSSSNYMRITGSSEPSEPSPTPDTPLNPSPSTSSLSSTPSSSVDFSQYLPLLALLQNNKDKLLDLFTTKQNIKIPRYTLAGACTAKSLQIPIVLDRLLKDFSNQKNVSQKDMLTVAVIEFLIKYGFELEVEFMLNSGHA